MSLSNTLTSFKYDNIDIICPTVSDKNLVTTVLEKYKELGFDVPNHTVIVFPQCYSKDEKPVAYPSAKLIMLFPSFNAEQIIYQYLHEVCHLLLGTLPQCYKWVGELLACSCSYFYYPYNSTYFNSLCQNSELDFATNKRNYSIIKDALPLNGYLVYTSSTPIETILYSYWLQHTDFDFTATLKEIVSLCHQKDKSDLVHPLMHILESN